MVITKGAKNALISEMPQTWNPQNDYYETQQNEDTQSSEK